MHGDPRPIDVLQSVVLSLLFAVPIGMFVGFLAFTHLYDYGVDLTWVLFAWFLGTLVPYWILRGFRF